jgi:hypothetical protein
MHMAYWLVQTNTGFVSDQNSLVAALKAENAAFKHVKCQPFTNNVQGLPPKYRTMPVTLFGSVNFIRWGQKKQLPGVWWNDNFSFTVQRAVYGDEMLNAEAEIHPFGGIPRFIGDRFIRPVDDGKAFAGDIIGSDRLVEWQDRIRYLNSTQLLPQTPVLIAPIKSIFREYRFFVVGGRVVTGSLYNEDNKLIKRALSAQDDPAVAYAQRMVDQWKPDQAFVIDVAVLNDLETMKIIEFNNINACGLYAADVRALVRAVNELLPG